MALSCHLFLIRFTHVQRYFLSHRSISQSLDSPRCRNARSILRRFGIVSGVISAGVSVPVQIPSQTPDLTGNYWPRLQWSQLFGFPPASLLVGQESPPPPPSVTPGAVSRPLLASLGIPTQSTQHQAPSTPATTPVHNSDTSEWNDWFLVTCSVAQWSLTRCPSCAWLPTAIIAVARPQLD